MGEHGTRRRAPGHGRAPFALALALMALWAAHAVLDPLAGLGVDPLLVLGAGGGLLACAVATACAAVHGTRAERLPWALVAGGLFLSAAGTISAHLRPAGPLDYALTTWEALRLASYAPLAVAVVLLIRRRIPRRRAGLWLDGAVTALCVQATLATLWVDDLVAIAAQGRIQPGAQLTAFALLGFDLALLGLATGALAHAGWRLADWGPILAATLGIAASDSVYLTRLAAGDWVPGQLWDAGWMLGAATVAAAALRGPSGSLATGRAGARGNVPVALALGAVGLMLAAAAADEPRPVTLVASALSIVMAVCRLGLSQQENERLLADAERRASRDSLTGLRNRSALERDLSAACARAARGDGAFAVHVVDLDAFKPYNDRHGHLAGDALLRDVAERLAAMATDGHAYRIGGDEFCVLAPAGGTPVRPGALGEDVRLSVGRAVIPAEATTPVQALELADRRMYRDKAGARSRR